MESERFDALTRAAARGASRRRLLAGALALAAAAAGVGVEWDEAAQAANFCKPPGAPCGRDRQCCAKKCRKRQCGCKGAGADCFQLGIVCCSGRCQRGKCRGG